jgi:hypothetical protein
MGDDVGDRVAGGRDRAEWFQDRPGPVDQLVPGAEQRDIYLVAGQSVQTEQAFDPSETTADNDHAELGHPQNLRAVRGARQHNLQGPGLTGALVHVVGGDEVIEAEVVGDESLGVDLVAGEQP